MFRKLNCYVLPKSLSVLALCLCVIPNGRSDVTVEREELPSDLTEVGLEKLLDFDLVVTSPGKKEQTLSKTASAIYVLSHEDIKRSGATHIAEALRLVPGVNVAKVSASTWAISIRGFNQVFANKLLVLVDGVSVFSPVTNGVYWHTLDLPLDDVDRIEVIRGPGAVLWGSNAVNGVINVITKSAGATLGGAFSISAGTEAQGIASVRYGVKVSDSTQARVSARGTHRTETDFVGRSGDSDDWNVGTIESRVDSDLGNGDALTFVGRAFSETDDVRTETPVLTPPFVDTENYSGIGHWNGGHAALNFRSTFADSSKLSVIGSVSHQARDSELIDVRYSVYELDATHQLASIGRHEFVYGASYRLFDNYADGGYAQDIIPSRRTMQRGNWFLQDEIMLLKDELHFIAGSKFEVNDSTGFEYMPNARLIWNANANNSIWTSWSRAVSPPSIVFEDSRFPVVAIPAGEQAPGTLVTIFGDRGVSSEDLYSYEVGYRSVVSEEVSIETAFFYNRYDNILTQEPGEPTVEVGEDGAPVVNVPLRFGNGLSATSIGGEVAVEYRPKSWLSFVGGYSYITAKAHQGNSLDTEVALLVEGSAPKHAVVLRTSLDFAEHVGMNVIMRYVDRLDFGQVSDYYEMDARIAWQATKEMELALVGQNLLHSSHEEYVGNLFGPPPIEIQRAVFGTFSYHF